MNTEPNRPKRDHDLGSLSDGISQMPRLLTARERFSDRVFVYFQITSWFIFIFAGIAGYAIKGLIGCVALLALGWLFGLWMRGSLGRRGSDSFHGYFRRIKERANGSRRGVLEWVIEKIRGSGYSVSKCQAITAAYERAMAEGQLATLPAQQDAILQRLDAEVKRISYSS